MNLPFITHKSESKRDIFLIIAVVLLSSLILYIPFIFNAFSWIGFQVPTQGMLSLYQNFDGLLYIVPAKAWYNPEAIAALRLEQTLPAEYYAAHLPMYPAFIAVFGLLFGYLKAMIVVTLLGAVAMALMFYKLTKDFKLTAAPLILSIVLLFLPRLFVVRSVGAPETLFIFFILSSIFFFEKKSYLLAGYLGGLAAMTKTPGILLFAGYALACFEYYRREHKINWQWLYLLFIPLGLVAVFALYAVQYGDFWAYFNTGGVVPMPYPFSAFNFQAKWVQTAWLEEIVLYLFIYGFAIAQLKDSKQRSLFYFSLVFLVASIFVQHRDLSRYLLPIWPFAAISYEKVLTSKKFVVIALLLLPAIYLYAWNFTLYNVLPISDWRPFL